MEYKERIILHSAGSFRVFNLKKQVANDGTIIPFPLQTGRNSVQFTIIEKITEHFFPVPHYCIAGLSNLPW
jgi:hypothetical protein